MNILARGLSTLYNDPTLFDNLRALIQEHTIGMILVGMPYTLKGKMGPKGNEVLQFIRQLQGEVSVAVTTWDERFTSRLARAAIKEKGTKKMERRLKEKVDQMASTLLLQSYLDSLKS